MKGCSLLVKATLTVEPGTIVKSEFGGILVTPQGTLLADGTAASPIVMTAVTDDSVGGDTNGDGAATGAQEEWLGIKVKGRSSSITRSWTTRSGP